MEYKNKKNAFVFDTESWEEALSKDYCFGEEPPVSEVENGVILPIRWRDDMWVYDCFYEGGVCREDGEFVAGHVRKIDPGPLDYNMSCLRGYEADIEVVRHETVIFGGMLINSFNHFVTECMSRLWWVFEHPEADYKIVFVNNSRYGIFENQHILDLIGITEDRIEIIDKATRFDKIIVPEQSVFIWSGFYGKWRKISEEFRKRIKPAEYKKIYLSRTQFRKKDGINEEYFEDFYRRRGYEIIYPEQRPIEEQISILSGADEVATTNGTLSNMLYFCRDEIKVTVLQRDNLMGLYDIFLMQSKRFDFAFVEANHNFLPTVHAVKKNAFFYGPTMYWQEYLDDRGISYEPDEVSFDMHVRPIVYDYVKKWAWAYRHPNPYRHVRNKDMYFVISNMHEKVRHKKIPPKEEYPENRQDEFERKYSECSRELREARKQIKSLTKDVEKKSRQIENLKNSASFRIGRLITAVPRRIRRIFCSKQ